MRQPVPFGLGIGIGAVGLTGTPSPTRKNPTQCADSGHPGASYNPWHDKTWCLCGAVTYPGNRFEHVACCGGPLETRTPDKETQR